MIDIRQLRKAARLTQIELAQQTGISRVRLSLAECDYVKLSHKELDLIQKVIAREPRRRQARIRAIAGGPPRTRREPKQKQ